MGGGGGRELLDLLINGRLGEARALMFHVSSPRQTVKQLPAVLLTTYNQLIVS